MSWAGVWQVQHVVATPPLACAAESVWHVWHCALVTLAEVYGTLV